jgi:hypothetical protein
VDCVGGPVDVVLMEIVGVEVETLGAAVPVVTMVVAVDGV